MTTNSVVTIRKSIESKMYEIITVEPSFSDERDISMRGSPVKNPQRSTSITPSMEMKATLFANSQGTLYIPPGEEFITILQEGGKYHILQINLQKGDILEYPSVNLNFNDNNFLRTVHKAHQLGATFRLPVDYHFFLPTGHENLTFKPTDPRNPGEGPLFTRSKGSTEFCLRFRTKN